MTAQASLFKTPEAGATYRAAYEASLRLWPTPRESLDVATNFGLTHVVACGPTAGAPVVLLPATSLSATMWYATVSGLCSKFRCCAVDFPSDIGLSTLANPPANRSDCAAWLNELLDGLGTVTASFVGASYSGFLALNYAIAEPARVNRLVLTSPAACFVALWWFYPRMFLSLLPPGRSAGASCSATTKDEFRLFASRALFDAKKLWLYPRTDRPKSDDKRIEFFAKAAAGLLHGIAPQRPCEN